MKGKEGFNCNSNYQYSFHKQTIPLNYDLEDHLIMLVILLFQSLSQKAEKVERQSDHEAVYDNKSYFFFNFNMLLEVLYNGKDSR